MELGLEPGARVTSVRWVPGAVVAELYRIGERLGAGGMGVVDRVRHLGWGQDLAVKSPRRELWAGSGGADAFLDEAKVWVNLPPHPHICTCHYVRVIDGVPRIFAEYVPGGSLADSVRCGGIDTLAEIVDVAIQMAWGLSAAHQAGVVHRDVKPANVLLAGDGTAKITDFGLASALARVEARPRSADGSDRTPRTHRGLTPAYASPEQLAGRPAGRPSDLWSWAVSVLELFTGEVTWHAGAVAGDALRLYLDDGARTAAPGRPAMPDAVAQLLMECFTIDPAQRPTGMDVLAERLVELYETEVGTRYPRAAGASVAHLADGLNNKALSLIDLDQTDDAESCLAQALRVDPRHANATFNQGLLQWRSARITDRQLVDRLETVREADVGAGVRNGRAHFLLGLVHLERGDGIAAAELLGEAARLAPGDPEVLAALRTATTDQKVNSAAPRTLTGHTRVVTAVAMTPDGRYAVSGSYDNAVRVWDLANGRCLHTLTGHTDHVQSVAITPDGRHALSGAADRTMRLWDISRGRCLRTLKGHSGSVNSVALTPDGRQALSGCSDGSLRWWQLKRRRQAGSLTGHSGGISSVALTPDARYCLSGDIADGTVRLWDLAGERCLYTLSGHTGGTFAVAVSPSGRYVLTSGEDGLARWWELTTGRCLRTLSGHTAWVMSVAIARCEGHVVTGGMDDTVRWWELNTGRCLRTLTGPMSSVTSVAVTDNSRHVVAGGLDGTVRWWELTSGVAAPWAYCRPQAAADVSARLAEFRSRIDEARRLLDREDRVGAAVALRLARAVPGLARHAELTDLWRRVGCGSRRTALLDVRAGEALTNNGHSAGIRSLAVTPDARHVLTGSEDRTARWWDLASGTCLRVFTGHTDTVSAVAATPDGRVAMTGSYDGTLRVWDVASGRCRTFTGHAQGLNAVAVTSDGRYAVTGAEDGEVRWWDLAGDRCLRVLTGHTSGVTSVAVTGDGRHAMSGGDGGTVLRWDLADGTHAQYWTGHTSWVTSISVSHDARHALTASNDHTLRWWDLAGERCLHTLTGHTGWVKSAAITRDARHAVSGSLDGTVRLWDLANGTCLRTFTAHDGYVVSVAVTEDGHRAVSCGTSRAAQVWELEWDYDIAASADPAPTIAE